MAMNRLIVLFSVNKDRVMRMRMMRCSDSSPR